MALVRSGQQASVPTEKREMPVLTVALTEASLRLGIDADRYPLEDRSPMQQDIVTVLKALERYEQAVREALRHLAHDHNAYGPLWFVLNGEEQ